jgi:hypothetical protein
MTGSYYRAIVIRFNLSHDILMASFIRSLFANLYSLHEAQQTAERVGVTQDVFRQLACSNQHKFEGICKLSERKAEILNAYEEARHKY